MTTEITGARRAALIAATVAGAVLIWCLRRPDQLLHPYVWVEEYQILNRFQHDGFLSASFHPYQGYYLLPTSLALATAAHWFSVVPVLDYAASTAWFVATLLLLLVPASPVPLPWRAALALALALVPADPEVYGILLYSFWWTGLWPLIALLWTKDHWALRCAAMVIGGASGIAGAVLVVPVALSYAWFGRRRRDLVGVALLTPILAVQVWTYLGSPRARAPLAPGPIAIQFLRNLSFFAATWIPNVQTAFLGAFGAAIALALVAIVISITADRERPLRREVVLAATGLVLLSVVSSVPAPLIAHPVAAGPRYYFLPFLLLSWLLLLCLAARPASWARPVVVGLLCLGAVSLSQGFVRRADAVNWGHELAKCRTGHPPFFVPVHYTGKRAEMWVDGLSISADTCRRLGYP